MTHCTRCGRRLKAPTDTGMGPKCALYMLGRKPKTKRQPKTEILRDKLTRDLFEGVSA